MAEAQRSGAEGETPVNPYSLLEAVNSSSETANTAWLIFLGIMAYLMVAVAGVTHKDLLLETPVALPILTVSVQQALFFEFAPVLLVLFHFGMIIQLVMLARKTLEFDYAVRALELTDRRTHPLRLELHNFFFVQGIAGPHRSMVMSAFLRAMGWLTLVVVPVLILLFIQISYLPYHDVTTTWVHRVCLAVDIAMLVLLGIFLLRAESSFRSAIWRVTISNPIGFLVSVAAITVVMFFSFMVATVPGEALDRITQTVGGGAVGPGTGTARPVQRAAASFAVPLLGRRSDGSLLGRFQRNLVVTDAGLVPDNDMTASTVSLNLRGRDLRYAVLDRSDLHRADLTGADLEGASLVGADLTRARIGCSDINTLILTDDRERAHCGSARGADFSRATLSRARLTGIDLTEAKLDEAKLDGADLTYALAGGASFSSARLEMADLSGGAQLQGANLLIASLTGADLSGAKLQGADLSSAALQGAILANADLTGAILRDADMEAADLQYARLIKVDLGGAKLKAADLRGASVWLTEPPDRSALQMADLGGLSTAQPAPAELTDLGTLVEKLEPARVKRQVGEALAGVLAGEARERWSGSAAGQNWRAAMSEPPVLPTGQEDYGKALTEHLTGLACKARFADASVATGIVKRAMGQQFRGSVSAVFERLRDRSCPAAASIAPSLMQRFSTVVDAAQGK